MPACAVGEPECSRAKLLADLDRVRPKRLELVVPMRSTNSDPVQNSDGRWLSTSGPVETVLHPTLARVDGGSNRVGWGPSCCRAEPIQRQLELPPQHKGGWGDSCGGVSGGPVMQQRLEEAGGECAPLCQMGPDAIFQ